MTMSVDAYRPNWIELSDQGLRVLVFARNSDVTTLHDAGDSEDDDEPILPPLTLLGIIAFSDELRPHLQETLSSFTDNGVKLKVISGDNPQTVAALARQAGLPGDLKLVSGPELAEMSQGEFTQAAVEATVFGRITPQQKEGLVTALRDQGEYVAMMGDGVNDVLSLKKANMGIAMESGSSATRAVAAMVLLGDSFEAMPAALKEGQRIVNSIQNILKLFMVTVFALLLLVVGITMLTARFSLHDLAEYAALLLCPWSAAPGAGSDRTLRSPRHRSFAEHHPFHAAGQFSHLPVRIADLHRYILSGAESIGRSGGDAGDADRPAGLHNHGCRHPWTQNGSNRRCCCSLRRPH